MKKQLFKIIGAIALLATVSIQNSYADVSEEQQQNNRWLEVKDAIFSDSVIEEVESDIVQLEVPDRAYDAAIVPIKINIDLPSEDQFIEQLFIIIDSNPVPLAATFDFETEQSEMEIQTRIRVNEYTHVRAVAKTNQGKYLMSKGFVKAAGGCSAPVNSPVMADQESAFSKVGKMKFKLFDSSTGMVGSKIGHVLIGHPNYSGMQFDQISRNYIPSYFIKKVTVLLDDKELFRLNTNFSLSEDPSIHFSFNVDSDQEGIITVHAVDSKDDQFQYKWPTDS